MKLKEATAASFEEQALKLLVAPYVRSDECAQLVYRKEFFVEVAYSTYLLELLSFGSSTISDKQKCPDDKRSVHDVCN